MVAQCANGGCNREFMELSKARLFLLPPAGIHGGARMSDHYYWLCPDCASLYILELEGTRPVVRLQRRERAASELACRYSCSV
jgi:hypothetical protein